MARAWPVSHASGRDAVGRPGWCLRTAPRHGASRLVAFVAAFSVLLLIGTGKVAADSAQYFYDPAGRLIAVVDPVNGSAQYTYDAVGNIVSVVRKSITDIMVAQ